jgi:hypothetical protein
MKIIMAEGLILTCLSLVALADAIRLTGHKTASVEDLTGPGRYLFVVSALLFIVSVAYFWVRRREVEGEAAEEESQPIDTKVVKIALLLVAYVIMIPYLGYVVATAPFCVGVMSVIGGRARSAGNLLAAVAITAVAYLIFVRGAGIIFPRGAWFF